jgi:hypothetical protein
MQTVNFSEEFVVKISALTLGYQYFRLPQYGNMRPNNNKFVLNGILKKFL